MPRNFSPPSILVVLVIHLAETTGQNIEPCVPKSPGSCQFVCKTGLFDFGPLQKQLEKGVKPYYTATDPTGNNYYFDPCGPITAVDCEGPPVSPVAAFQSYGGVPPHMKDSCAALGQFSTATCATMPHLGDELERVGQAPGPSPPPLPKSMQCSYTGGDGGRKVEIIYSCQETTAGQTASSDGSLSYKLTMKGPSACMKAFPPPPMSWGTATLITFLCLLVAYLLIGIVYNVRYKGQRGIKVVPQWDYWKQLPGLVKDGLVFTKHHSYKAYYHVVHRRPPPLDSSLKQRLADNGDDDGT